MLTCGQIPDIVVGIAHDQTVSNRAFDYSGGVEKTLSAHRHERHIAQPEHLTFDIQAPFLAGSQPLLHGQVGVRSLFIDSIENSRSHSLDCERTRRIQGLLSAVRRGARNAAHCVIVVMTAPYLRVVVPCGAVQKQPDPTRSEEHTSELQSLMRISYAVF